VGQEDLRAGGRLYNYGQITAKWVAHYVKQRGGSGRQDRFSSRSTWADFGSTIAKIQQEKPDAVCAALVGGRAPVVLSVQWGGLGHEQEDPACSPPPSVSATSTWRCRRPKATAS